jgi:hypothetical protein
MRMSSLRPAVHTSSVDRSGIAAISEFADPPTTAGLGPRWRTVLSDGLSDAAVGRNTGRPNGHGVLAVSFWINWPFAAAPDLA